MEEKQDGFRLEGKGSLKYCGNFSRNPKEDSQKKIPQLSPWKQVIYVCVVWIFWVISLYTLIFISWFGALAPFTVAQLTYSRGIKKNKLALFPYQRQFKKCVHATLFYDMLIRKVNGNKSLLVCRHYGLFSLVIGLFVIAFLYTSPVLNLDDMFFMRGTYESYLTLNQKNTCGQVLLTFRQEDGTLVNLWDVIAPKELEKTKGDLLSIWGEPKTRSVFAECRKYPSVAQIIGNRYQRLYERKRVKKTHRVFLNIAIFLITCSCLCLSRIVWVYRHDNENI
ncbi:MAG: hypothetical protein P4L42_06280 [Desulfocapsaceae bacterium]|nr:hypothetical protein [Desulfocapsaceae bacterium]